jgi:hypothetical protein
MRFAAPAGKRRHRGGNERDGKKNLFHQRIS